MGAEADRSGQRRPSVAATNGTTRTPANPNDPASIPSRDEEPPASSIDMSRQASQDYEREHNDHTFCQSTPSREIPAKPRPRTATKFSTETNGNVKTNTQISSTAALEPPVTKGTLSELDVNKIVHNPKLRHDINFDPDLHFRPNLDGEKGKRKTKKADEFWGTMRNQLRDYLMQRETFEAELKDPEWCLPATLKAIRGILETLVPQRDRSSVEESFNVDLLMQQFRKGVADLEKLALWLSQLLKCHCAPMRDEWVDEMVTQLSNGDKLGDVAMLVQGMRNLLGVLEAMKLDVANHQIRCLRPLLIEDTVQFEQKFFMKKIALGRVDIPGAHAWFKRAESLPNITELRTSHSQSNTWDFFKALVNLTLNSKASEIVPHTFLFDEERLIKLRADMLDAINLEICMQLHRQIEASSRAQSRHSANLYISTPITSHPASPADTGLLSSPTIPSEHDFRMKVEQSNLAQEKGHFRRSFSGRQIWVPNVEEDVVMDSQYSSPTSSPASNASQPPNTTPVTPLYLSQQSSDSASQVRSSLLAILASASSGTDKWGSLSSSLALQILRATPGGLKYVPQFESQLTSHLSNPKSVVYQEAEQRVLTQLFPILHKLVMQYVPLTSLQIFELATAPRIQNARQDDKEQINEIATRIAHIGILHWRVWAPLAYLVGPDAEEEAERPDEMVTGMD
ncbi:T-complex protein 11 [Phlyctema vagabunda]|uniref:T-complex protein 11 n=1 Tax=Phlyctema vagabunda TaxID=108571 RepID=A0ABR4PBG9_9HELO